LYRWNGATPAPLTLASDVNFPTVTFARADRSQRLWLGSGDRIGVLDTDGTFRALGSAGGLDPRTSLRLYDVFEDAEGVVWLGTSAGLSRFADGRMTSIGSAQGLPGDRVWSVVEDLKGDFWLSLDRGIVRVSRSDIAHAMTSPTHRMPYQMYDPKDGLAGSALGTLNSAREPNGRLWFVRGGGVTEVNPGALMPRTAPPAIRIEEAKANDQRLELSEHSLPAGTRRLEVSFTVLTLPDPTASGIDIVSTASTPTGWTPARVAPSSTRTSRRATTASVSRRTPRTERGARRRPIGRSPSARRSIRLAGSTRSGPSSSSCARRSRGDSAWRW
jgi:hypothetical protein